MRRTTPLRLGPLLAALLTLLLARISHADPDAGAVTWPQRAFETELGAKGVVLELAGDPRRYGSDRISMFEARPNATEHVRRMLEAVGEPARGVDASAVEAEGANALVFNAPPADWVDPVPDGSRTLLFVSLQPESYAVERTWMAYEPATTERVDGLAVIVPGTFGYPSELYEKWSDDLRSRGWSVLRLLSQPSRFTEHVLVEIDEDAAAAGAAFAARADDRTAEAAYAVEHGARFVETLDPRLARLPRTILGFSGGAILSPGIVAREPDRYETIVLVAGGVNAASISIDSTFMARFIRSVTFRFDDEDRQANRETFESAYLEASALDGYHGVLHVADDARVLVIDGSLDQAVPFDSSELMVRRLSMGGVDPIRRTYPVNHVMLFMALNESLGQINDWIDGPAGAELALPPGE